MKNTILFSLILLTLTFSGCKKLLDVDSVRVVSEENMWKSMEDARAALLGTYALTRAALADNEAYWIYGEVRTGEFKSPNRQDLKAIINNDLNASYPVIDALSNWRRWYAVINSANLFLENINRVKANDPHYTDINMKVDIAQERVLRAYAYFYITRIWGDAPFITSSHDGQFDNKPREKQERILAFAEQELLEAATDLPYRYASNDPQQPGDTYYNLGYDRWSGALVRKLTAYSILSHIAAWQGNYAKCAQYTKFIEDNYGQMDIYFMDITELVAAEGYYGIFSSKKELQLFGFSFDWNHVEGSFYGHIENLTLADPVVNKPLPDIYLPKDSIISIFNEPNDYRFSLDTLGHPTSENYFANFNGKYPIFCKSHVIQGGTTDPTFRIFASTIVLDRMEDIQYLRAEALTVLGDQDEAKALLNQIRGYRGLPDYDPAVNGNLIDAIFKERQRELMGEGHRWYDLIRYNKIRRNNQAFLKLIESGGIYWPIAKSLLEQNKLLKQNPYWQ